MDHHHIFQSALSINPRLVC